MRTRLLAMVALVTGLSTPAAQAEPLKPFVLARAPAGDMALAVKNVQTCIAGKGFQIVGRYSPYPQATVICMTGKH